jgi:NADPH:quinone reductase-like Zn-dependent oxidoreductase
MDARSARGSYTEYAAIPAAQIVADAVGLNAAAGAIFQGVTAH